MTFSDLVQSVHPSRAKAPLGDLLPVFKSTEGLILHDDLAGVLSAQHHERYTSMSTLMRRSRSRS